MRIFQCNHCYQPVFFENSYCGGCGHLLGYVDSVNEMFALSSYDSSWSINGTQYTYCKNVEHGVCNWLVPEYKSSSYCTACNLNRTIPDLRIDENKELWAKLEQAKHRLIYSLQRLGLPVISKNNDLSGFCFDFLSSAVPDKNGNKPMTGHKSGEITIVLSEADSIQREQIRLSLEEPYRSLAGHFRHEIGHYYWPRLVLSDEHHLQRFRELFGDEKVDYSQSLKTYYQTGGLKNWQNSFISQYATAHPWEDWAETWAHYLHIINAMDTAYHFGLKGDPHLANTEHMEIQSVDPYTNVSFQKIIEETVPLFFAINSLNRSMGIPDIYPFVISEPVKRKLEFIHEILLGHRIR
ncbi:zinc-binding metallopeptidase family protein [Jiulongibacter sediminis]|uniref:Zinc-ribbon domain-containing protein n=1 Tax=Jiulongibacter sediminis TaxID=1605367 RepID=A0A0P7BZZ7_9BACT|nr:putative zinc-binding metallopeptidase [Jiulongibacter sediminis]KPM49962.1 hypothetical protein AFM12_05205 [Jiulongibacter sediminis]TBX26995.1 hypothetical protein TK44_05210 [Jiulongibacter sediminis]